VGRTGKVNVLATGQAEGNSSSFTITPVTPPGRSTVTLSNIAITSPGNSPLIVPADDGSDQQSVNLSLDIFNQVPATASLTSPTNGNTSVAANAVVFSWGSVTDAQTHQFELATDIGFSNIVESALVNTNSYTSGLTLSPNSKYYWRVSST